MDTTFDHLVTTDAQTGPIVTHDTPLSSTTSNEGSILDLSQRPPTTTETKNSTVIIDNWNNDLPCVYSDAIDDDFNNILILNKDQKFNIEQSLTDQLNDHLIKEDSLSDNSNLTQSKLDYYSSTKKTK
jgi:hypothetical protein